MEVLVPVSLAVWTLPGGGSVCGGQGQLSRLAEGSLGRAGRGWRGREVFSAG